MKTHNNTSKPMTRIERLVMWMTFISVISLMLVQARITNHFTEAIHSTLSAIPLP